LNKFLSSRTCIY